MKQLIIIVMLLIFGSICQADYLGKWRMNDNVTVSVTTHQFSTGAAYAATGDVHLDIYEDDTNTQIVDDTNMSNFDSVTGLYLVKVALASATGFEEGKHYTCVVSATVDGVAGILTHNFQIEETTEAWAANVESVFAVIGLVGVGTGLFLHRRRKMREVQ